VSFDTSAYLRRATGRAKSDVANKLVSMFLHGVSRKLAASLGLAVTDAVYTTAVAEVFGVNCAYCGRSLEHDRAAVEHLDGMNRFRVGLHIPGNVVLACKRCNSEKRRDDSLNQLVLAETGWESFLAHGSSRCGSGCKTCAYWRSLWPAEIEPRERLLRVHVKIAEFRARYPRSIDFSEKARTQLRPVLDKLYRDCQRFATETIQGAVDDAVRRLQEGSLAVNSATCSAPSGG
jgi:HNH endonuclease